MIEQSDQIEEKPRFFWAPYNKRRFECTKRSKRQNCLYYFVPFQDQAVHHGQKMNSKHRKSLHLFYPQNRNFSRFFGSTVNICIKTAVFLPQNRSFAEYFGTTARVAYFLPYHQSSVIL